MLKRPGRAARVLVLALAGMVVTPGPATVRAVRADAPLQTAQRLSRDWKWVRSANFVAVGNAPPADLRKALSDLEAFRAALATLFPGLRLDAPVPTTIVVFRDSDAFDRYRPRDAQGRPVSTIAGFFSARPHENLIAFDADNNREKYSVIFHEFTHYVMARNVSTLPLWLSEGFAEFLSTFEPTWQNGKSVVGRAPEGRLRTLRDGGFIPLPDLLAPKDMESLWSSDRIGIFYAEAWALVHMLAAGPGLSLAKYAEAIQTTGSPGDAFAKAFGVDVPTAERQLQQYIKRYQFLGLTLTLPDHDESTAPVEPMREGDVHRVLGDVLIDNGAFEEADREAAAALALDPADVDARIVRARIRGYTGRLGEAIDALATVAVSAPSNFAAPFYLGVALADARRHEEALAAFDRALAVSPDSAPALVGASISALALKQDARADAAFRRALESDVNAVWYRNRAFAAFGIGRDDVVVADVHEYLRLVGWAEEGAPYAGLIAALSLSRLGRADDADALLADAERAVSAKTWTATVVQFLRGRISSEDLVSKAKDVGQKTEAHAYVGLRAELAGHWDEAFEHLQWVVTQGARSYSEYDLARREIGRITEARLRGQVLK